MNGDKVYRISLSAAEVEQALKSIPDKLDKDAIIDDWKSGSSDQVISADVLSSILKTLDARTKGEGLKQQISSAEDCNIFTDSFKSTLESLTFNFIGVISDIAERDKLNTQGFRGFESIWLLENDFGNATLQYYNPSTTQWVDLFPDQANTRTLQIANASTNVIRTTPFTTSTVMTFEVSAKTAGAIQSSTVKIGTVPGTTTPYMLVSNELLSNVNQRVFNLDSSISGTNLELSATTLMDNVSIRVELLSKL